MIRRKVATSRSSLQQRQQQQQQNETKRQSNAKSYMKFRHRIDHEIFFFTFSIETNRSSDFISLFILLFDLIRLSFASGKSANHSGFINFWDENFRFWNSFFICRPEQSTDRMTDILSWSIRSQNGKEERNKLVHKWLTCVWRQLLQLMHTHTCIQITNRFVLMKNRFQINWCLEIGFLLMSGDKIILEHSQWMTICVFSVWNWLLWIAKNFILTNAKPQTI